MTIFIIVFEISILLYFWFRNRNYKRGQERKRAERVKYADERYIEAIKEIRKILGYPEQTSDELLEWKYPSSGHALK